MANSPVRAALDVGSVIAGTYTIEALIGRGGGGAVFVASHARLPGKRVAIKVLHPGLADEEVVKRFQHEARITSMLGHPNIVAVHDFNALPDGTPYLVLDYLDGETLAERIKRGPMPLAEVCGIVRQIGSALSAAHRADVIHRDLKPQNVFLVPTEVGGEHVEQVKLLDFGISKMRGQQSVQTNEHAMLGTPAYMAPEQATGRQAAVDARTDVFALGAIVYEMLGGQPAFSGASVPEVVFKVVYEEPVPLAERVPGIDPAIATAVHRALEKKPEDRFASVADLVEALTGEKLAPPREPRTSSPVVWGRKDTSDEALARTVDSGTGAKAAEEEPRADLAFKETVATGPGVAPPAPARRGRLLVIGLGVAAVAAIAVVIAVRSGGHEPMTSDAAPVIVAASIDAAAAPPPRSIDAPVAVTGAVDARVATTVADARAGKRRVDAPNRPPTRLDAGPIDPLQRTVEQVYNEGVSALMDGNWSRAQMLGSKLINRGSKLGFVLRAAAACLPNFDRVSDYNTYKLELRGDRALVRELDRLCAQIKRRR